MIDSSWPKAHWTFTCRQAPLTAFGTSHPDQLRVRSCLPPASQPDPANLFVRRRLWHPFLSAACLSGRPDLSFDPLVSTRLYLSKSTLGSTSSSPPTSLEISFQLPQASVYRILVAILRPSTHHDETEEGRQVPTQGSKKTQQIL